VNLQGKLFASNFVEDVYRGTKNPRVHLARNVFQPDSGEREWFQSGYNLSEAIEMAEQYQQDKADDCYVTTHGYKFGRRTTSDVNQLTGFYVDFDYYDTEYSHLSVAELCDLVLAENPWLPEPTMVMSSGKGSWMFWKFQRVLYLTKNTEKYYYLAQWQTTQTFLVSQLKKYGADPKCCDAARVVRLPETINSKNGRKAEAWETGTTYKFGDIKGAISTRYKELNPKQVMLPRTEKRTNNVSPLFNWYSLAHNRMNDLKMLATLRGGRLSDHRRMAAWIYAVSAANYCRTEDSLRAEVSSFIKGHMTEPEKNLRTINYESTVKRFNAHMELRLQGMSPKQIEKQLGASNDIYKTSHKYIIRILEITPAEQRKMKVIIGKDEKKIRDAKRKNTERRAAGVPTRSEYDNEASRVRAQNVLDAVRLRLDGLSVRQIGVTMGKGVGTVHRWLKEG
tara:strand:- start:1089 stop:2441 length:1353 start_codon:yes stop_codon:yes gene_type:complete